MGGLHPQLPLQGADEGVEEIQAQGFAALEDGPEIVLHHGAEHEGPVAVLLGAALMRATASLAFSTLSMNGRVTWVTPAPSNWLMRLRPRASAVMPVRSETKNTVRRFSIVLAVPDWVTGL